VVVNPFKHKKHLCVVKEAVQQERQRLSQAQKIIEQNIGRPVSKEPLSRFLKLITAVTNG
jgi:transcriptional regulator GlxA family with amidase domain